MKYLIAFFALASIAIKAIGAEYYLSSTGNDANVGSFASPWRNVTKATSTAVAGDTIHFPTNDLSTYAAITLTETTDGTAGNYISYVGHGTRMFRAVTTGADYTRIIGFEFTHTAGTSSGVTLGGSFQEVIDCYIHHTGGVSVDPNGASDFILRGNTMLYPGSPGNNSGAGTKCINDNADSVRGLIEYNYMSHCTDFVSPRGSFWIVRNNHLGPSVVTDFGGAPHVDGWQSNAQMRHGWMYRNWHVDNSVSDSHMILIESPVDIPDASARSGWIAVTENVSLRSGDQLWYQMRDGFNLYSGHNIVGQIGYGPRGGPGSSGFFYVWGETFNSNTNFAMNDVYWQVTTTGGVVYTVNAGSSLTRKWNTVAPNASDFTTGVEGNLEFSTRDQLGFSDYDANNLIPISSSPNVGTASNLTSVTTGGIGTSFTVGDPNWFADGLNGLCEGRKIYVGDDNNLIITSINYTTGVITVSTPFVSIAGDKVGFAYLGSAPDRGAYEYGAIFLTGATYTKNLSDYTVDPIGEAEFVVGYRNGVPYAIDTEAPFVVTIPDGEVSIKVYALRAQETLFFTATDAGSTPPPPPPVENSSQSAEIAGGAIIDGNAKIE